MSDDEKARLYRQILQQNDDYFLLERMRLYGFWRENEGLPQDPVEEAEERNKIVKEMDDLRRAHALANDPEKALAEERKRRWRESIERRRRRKEEREKQRKQRREEFEARRRKTIVHVGEGFSAGLERDQSDESALAKRGLPIIHRAEDLANLAGVSIAKLRWLTFHRRGAAAVHYRRYEIAKKTGGARCISAPKPALAALQQWVLANVLAPLDVTPHAHGFIPGRSIVSNAAPHVGRKVVINLDLQDFFPSLNFRRVKGLFQKLGYSEHAATILALLCTEPPRVAAEHRGKVYHVALNERALPQGACTSPAITNAVCRRLDRRLAGLAQRHQFTYTRYADDLTFSGDRDNAVGRLLRSAHAIIEKEGFTVHPTKTRIMRRTRRQEVTGVTVNKRTTVLRREIRTLRAILHNAAKHGLESQNRDNLPNFLGHLKGRIAYICMIDPQQGAALKEKLEQLHQH